jgi:hypothetical protein
MGKIMYFIPQAYKILIENDGMFVGAHIISDHSMVSINTICLGIHRQIHGFSSRFE